MRVGNSMVNFYARGSTNGEIFFGTCFIFMVRWWKRVCKLWIGYSINVEYMKRLCQRWRVSIFLSWFSMSCCWWKSVYYGLSTYARWRIRFGVLEDHYDRGGNLKISHVMPEIFSEQWYNKYAKWWEGGGHSNSEKLYSINQRPISSRKQVKQCWIFCSLPDAPFCWQFFS